MWSSIDSFGAFILKFGFSIAIARLLVPKDYGLLGMMLLFWGIATWVFESGMSDALIQKKDTTTIDYSTVFYFQLTISILFYLIFYFSAPMIAAFYDTAELVRITRVGGLNLVINALANVQQTILIKNLNFKVTAKINAISSFLSGIIGLAFAYLGYGVWALIYQMLLGDCIKLLLLWIKSSWRPVYKFDYEVFKKLYRYGYKILIQGVLNAFFSNIYFVLIGKYYHIDQLGFYARARRFSDLFVMQVAIVFNKVNFPTFSVLQNDLIQYRLNYIKMVRSMAYIVFPIFSILMITAHDFVLIFLTEKWIHIVPYLILLYIEGFYFPFYLLNLTALNSLGYSGKTLKIEIVKKSLIAISIFSVINMDIKYLIIGYIFSSFISFIVGISLLSKFINIRFVNFFEQIFPSLILSGISCFLVKYLSSILFLNSWIILLFNSIFTLLVYLVLSKLFHVRAYCEIKKKLLPYLPEKIQFIV